MSTQTSYERLRKAHDESLQEVADLKSLVKQLADALVETRASLERQLLGKAVDSGELGFVKSGIRNYTQAGRNDVKDVSADVLKRVRKGAQ